MLIAALVVPAPLLVTCFIVLMILGLYLTITALRHPPRGGRSTIKVLKSQLELTGPAWLVLLAIGVVITASPVLATVMQRQAVEQSTVSETAKDVLTIEEPNFASFVFLDDLSYVDLRRARTAPWYAKLPGIAQLPSVKGNIRPATLVNTMRIRKIAAAEQLHITYETSGALNLRCLTQPYRARLAKASDGETGEIVVNVSAIPIGAEFTVVTEVTYWNAFYREPQEDYSTYTHQQSIAEHIGVVIVFPDDKTYQYVNVTRKLGENAGPYVGPQEIGQNQSRTGYYWAATVTGKQAITFRWNW